MSDFEIYNKKDKVDTCYGHYPFKISRKDIEALLKGKKLYTTTDDEYAITITLEEDKAESEG